MAAPVSLRPIDEASHPTVPPGRRPSMGEIGLNQFDPYLLNRISARWNADMAEVVKAHDLTTARMRALAVLSVAPGLTINELSVYAVTEQSTLSRNLDAMEEQGLIRRRMRAEDGRVREIHLTEKGRETFRRLLAGDACTLYVALSRHPARGTSPVHGHAP